MKSPWSPRLTVIVWALVLCVVSGVAGSSASGQCKIEAYSIGLGLRITPAIMVHPETGELWMYGSSWSSMYTDTWVRRPSGWELIHTGGPEMGQMEFDPVLRMPLMVWISPQGEIKASWFTGDYWRPSAAITLPPNRVIRKVVWALDRNSGAWLLAGTWGDADGIDVQETWRYAEGAWVFLGGAPTRPVHMTHSQARGRFVAAVDIDGSNGAIWEWDGVNWNATGVQRTWLRLVERSTVASDGTITFAGSHLMAQWNGVTLLLPPPMDSHTTSYSAFKDPQSGNTWGVGGSRGSGIAPICFQTNELVGTQWVARDRTASAYRGYLAGAWNPNTSTFVLFGGSSVGSDYQSRRTIVFRGTSGASWEHQETPNSPPWRQRAAMGFDFVSGKIIMFGGETDDNVFLNDTWLYDGVTWTQYQGPSPSRRPDAIMATDTHRNRVVLMGYQDTWEWDGAQWLMRGPGPSVHNSALVYDPVRRICVSFSGEIGRGTVYYLEKTRTWNGNQWTETVLPGPHVREGHVSYFDAALGGVVISGGYYTYMGGPGGSTTDSYGDSWLFDGNSWTELPVQELGVAIDQIVVPLGSGPGAIAALGGPLNEVDAVRIFTTAPFIFKQPRGGDTARGQVLALDARVGGDHDQLLFRWYRNGQALFDGGRVQGARTVHLRIADARDEDAGSFLLLITNACTSTSSDVAIVRVCAADFNADGMVDLFDYLDFVDAWASLRSEADFDGDGVVDLSDYLEFVERFGVGC